MLSGGGIYGRHIHASVGHRERGGLVRHGTHAGADSPHPPPNEQHHRTLRRRCSGYQGGHSRDRFAARGGHEREGAAATRRRRPGLLRPLAQRLRSVGLSQQPRDGLHPLQDTAPAPRSRGRPHPTGCADHGHSTIRGLDPGRHQALGLPTGMQSDDGDQGDRAPGRTE